MRLANREDYEDRWTNTGPVASYDRETWFRLPATFDRMVFSFEHTPDHDLCYYATFAPFPIERDEQIIARAQVSPRARLEDDRTEPSRGVRSICSTDRRARPCRRRDAGSSARQHPSETQGGYFLEGMLFAAPHCPNDPVSLALARQGRAPCRSQHESRRHRQWPEPGATCWPSISIASGFRHSLERSPEVVPCVLRKDGRRSGSTFRSIAMPIAELNPAISSGPPKNVPDMAARAPEGVRALRKPLGRRIARL